MVKSVKCFSKVGPPYEKFLTSPLKSSKEEPNVNKNQFFPLKNAMFQMTAKQKMLNLWKFLMRQWPGAHALKEWKNALPIIIFLDGASEFVDGRSTRECLTGRKKKKMIPAFWFSFKAESWHWYSKLGFQRGVGQRSGHWVWVGVWVCGGFVWVCMGWLFWAKMAQYHLFL